MKDKHYKSGLIWGHLHVNDGVPTDKAVDLYFKRFTNLSEAALGTAMGGILDGYDRPRPVMVSNAPDKRVEDWIKKGKHDENR